MLGLAWWGWWALYSFVSPGGGEPQALFAQQALKAQRQALEAELGFAEHLQFQLLGLRGEAEASTKHWHESHVENQWAQEQNAQKIRKLAQECRQYHPLMRKLGVQGAAALRAGRAPSEWAVATHKLQALLQKCQERQHHLSQEAQALRVRHQRLLQLQANLRHTHAQFERVSEKIRLHNLGLTNALTALPDMGSPSPSLSYKHPFKNSAPGAARGAAPGTASAIAPAIVWASLEEEPSLALWKGRLYPPLFGFVERPFGFVVNPQSNTLTQHKGISIRAARGSRVRAVASGKVVYTGELKGFGRLIIMEHGGGYHTLVAHLGEIFIKAGEWIEQGSWLGTVGEAQPAGAWLYFEIRQQGLAQNPMEWFVQAGFR